VHFRIADSIEELLVRQSVAGKHVCETSAVEHFRIVQLIQTKRYYDHGAARGSCSCKGAHAAMMNDNSGSSHGNLMWHVALDSNTRVLMISQCRGPKSRDEKESESKSGASSTGEMKYFIRPVVNKGSKRHENERSILHPF
jgi:hypothetical protein